MQMNTMWFYYYDMNKTTETIHIEDDGETLCGTAYLLDKGEFLYLKNDYDRGIMEQWFHDPEHPTCKRCIKKWAKLHYPTPKEEAEFFADLVKDAYEE